MRVGTTLRPDLFHQCGAELAMLARMVGEVVGAEEAEDMRRRYSARYRSVLASDRWQSVRGEALRKAGYRCQDCGMPARRGIPLDGHHWRGYAMLGHESASDVRILCRECHEKIHGRGRRRGSGLWRVVACGALLLALGHSLGWW